jgi:hypothetical protein
MYLVLILIFSSVCNYAFQMQNCKPFLSLSLICEVPAPFSNLEALVSSDLPLFGKEGRGEIYLFIPETAFSAFYGPLALPGYA